MKHSSINRTFSSTVRRVGLHCAALGAALGLGVATSQADGTALVPGSAQDFEGGGLGFSLGGGFGSGGTTDYWQVIPNNGSRVNSATITTGGVFANASPSGGSVLAGDDTNAGGTSPVVVTFNAVNISGLTNLSANVLLAASNPTQGASNRGFEGTDFLEIQVSYNGGAFQRLAIYEQDPSHNGGTNSFLSQDTNNDGLGDAGSGAAPTAIGQGFKNFSHPLDPATTVRIRIQIRAEATGEYVAIDNFRICGDPAVTDPPVLGGVSGTALNYAEGDAATTIAAALTVTDADSSTLTGATVQISSNNTPTEDVLAATGVGGVTVQPYVAGTGTLTFTGTASLADYRASLRTVTYLNTNVLNPNIAQRTVSFQGTDDQANNSAFAMRNINVANGIQTFSIPHTESFDDGVGTGDRYEVVGGFDVGPNDFFRQLPTADATTRYAIPIGGVMGDGFFGGEDIDQNGLGDEGKVVVHLNATGFGNLSVEVLLAAAASNPFEGSDGLWVEYQFDGGAWFGLMAFRPVSGGGDLAEDTDDNGVGDGTALTSTLTNFSLPILDAGNLLMVRVRALCGTTSEEIAIDELTVTGNPVGAPPVLSNIASGPLGYTEGDGAVVISATATITDADDTNLESATVGITSNYVNGEDVLSFTPSGGITGSFAMGTGILTLTGSASLAAYETVLKSVTYENTNLVGPSQDTRTVSYRVHDGESNSAAQGSLIEVLDLVPAQPLPHCESFETDGLGTRYAANSFNFASVDLFDREEANFGGLIGSNADGDFAFVGKDTDADGNPVHSLEIIVDTSNATSLMLDLKLAAVVNQFEPGDTILIERAADGGGFVRLTSFHGSGINTSLSEDTNDDGSGDGGTTLGPDYTDHSFALPDANETRIRITMNTSASGEETAVDNICLTGTDNAPPVADLADPSNGSSVDSAVINSQAFIEVTFTDVGFSGVDPATINGDEMVLSGAAAAGVTLNGSAHLLSGTTYRYPFSGNFVPGVIMVKFSAGTFADVEGNPNDGENEGFTVLNSAPVAGPDTIDRHPTQSVKIPVATLLVNDSDPDGNTPLMVTGISYTGGNGAQISLVGGVVFYLPNGHTGDDTFDYTVEDSLGAASTGSVTLHAIGDDDPSINRSSLNIKVDLQGGNATITGAGIPGRAYRIQARDTNNPNAWVTIATVVASAEGVINFTDPGPLPLARIYRTVHP